jgi:hypothetical protein
LVMVILLLFAMTAIAAAEYLPACPFCGNNAVRWTGESKVFYGRTMYLWWCTQEHYFWRHSPGVG